MKKILSIIVTFLILVGVAGGLSSCKHHDDTPSEQVTTAVENLISQDIAYMDSVADNYKFFECRVVLDKPFNEAENFVAQEVTNVFQQNIKTDDGYDTVVYFFTHQINDTYTDIDIHEHAMMFDDEAMCNDSIQIDFDKAFTLLKQSNYPPSTSRYITLRKSVAQQALVPYYIIGNDNTGLYKVNSYTGEIVNK